MKISGKYRSFISLITGIALTISALSPVLLTAFAETPDELTISENGLQFIVDREGFAPTCFWDYAQWTVGYGTRCTGEDHPSEPYELQKGPHTITRDEAKERFLSALETTYIPGVRRQLAGLEMDQPQFDALVSLCYNAGEGKLANSPFAKYLRGELTRSQAYSDYCGYVITAGGKVNQGLINRRRLEAELFFSNVPNDSDEPPTVEEGCFQPCAPDEVSIVDALVSIGADPSFGFRKRIAEANGIVGYSGTAEQNVQMLNMLKAGILRDPDYVSDDGVPGDCNGDGEVTVADMVILHKYLLGIEELPDCAFADLFGDGRIDAFDMIEMRKRVING